MELDLQITKDLNVIKSGHPESSRREKFECLLPVIVAERSLAWFLPSFLDFFARNGRNSHLFIKYS